MKFLRVLYFFGQKQGLFEARSHYIAQAGLKLMILLP
jgi:hypothetical protein